MVALSCNTWNEPPPHRAGRVIGQTRGMSDGMNPQEQEHPQVLVVGPDGIATSAGDQDESAGRERPVTELLVVAGLVDEAATLAVDRDRAKRKSKFPVGEKVTVGRSSSSPNRPDISKSIAPAT